LRLSALWWTGRRAPWSWWRWWREHHLNALHQRRVLIQALFHRHLHGELRLEEPQVEGTMGLELLLDHGVQLAKFLTLEECAMHVPVDLVVLPDVRLLDAGDHPLRAEPVLHPGLRFIILGEVVGLFDPAHFQQGEGRSLHLG